jgi:rhamnosyltransferase
MKKRSTLTNKVKVAIIGSRGLPPRYGGFEIFAHYLAQHLADQNYLPVIYCVSTLKNLEYDRRIKRVFIKTPPIRSLEKLTLSNLATLHAVFSEKADVIIYLGVSGGLTAWIPKLLKIPIILNPDGLEWKRKKWNFLGRSFLILLERIAVRLSDTIIADNVAIGNYIETRYRKKWVFIPYGCNDCLIHEGKWEELKDSYGLEKNNYYLVVGRNVPENNHDLIISGFLKSNSGKKLVIVSDKPANKPAKDEKIIFTGPIFDNIKLNTLRKYAFAYIHGHSVGGTNPSLLEAIACDNLVIAYDVPFNREVLEKYGLYFRSDEELENIIKSLELADDPIQTGMLKFYEQIRVEKYNWQRVVEAYEKVIREVAKP